MCENLKYILSNFNIELITFEEFTNSRHWIYKIRYKHDGNLCLCKLEGYRRSCDLLNYFLTK